jgi:LmbE family N-acetylglucosaminyl deacetylase
VPLSIVFLHAHPDDEALLTGGTMARLARQGHRVVLVTATDGAAGLMDAARVDGPGEVAAIRREELQQAARELGVVRLIQLGYADSGLDGRGTSSTPGLRHSGDEPFALVPVAEAAARVAEILRDESADCLVGYDCAGGYGHPDHVQVHRVAREAAAQAGTPLLLEATMPREPFKHAARAARVLRRVLPPLARVDLEPWESAYTPAAQITHRVDVRPGLPAKRAALAAHRSQAVAGGSGLRTIDAALRLPGPLFAGLFGTEWFTGPANPQGRYFRHPLESLARRGAS